MALPLLEQCALDLNTTQAKSIFCLLFMQSFVNLFLYFFNDILDRFVSWRGLLQYLAIILDSKVMVSDGHTVL